MNPDFEDRVMQKMAQAACKPSSVPNRKEMEGELQSSQEENRRFRSEHNTLLMQLDNLKDVLQQKLAELESQAVELTAAVAQRQHLLEQVEQLQSELAACRTQLASERRRAEEEQKKREMQEPPGAWEPGSGEVHQEPLKTW